MAEKKQLSYKDTVDKKEQKLNRTINKAIKNANLEEKLKVKAVRTLTDEIAISFYIAEDTHWFTLGIGMSCAHKVLEEVRERLVDALKMGYVKNEAKTLNLEDKYIEYVEDFVYEFLKLLDKQFVLVANEDGEIERKFVKEIIENEETLIIDNTFWGYKHSDEYSEKEINKYESEARHELKLLKKAMREHPYSLFGIEKNTESLKEIIVNNSKEPREYSKEEAKLAMQKLNERSC